MNRALFLKRDVFSANQRTQKNPVAHHRRNVSERILLNRQIFRRKGKREFCRLIGNRLHLEILLQKFLGVCYFRYTHFVLFGGKRINLFHILRGKCPKHHAARLAHVHREHTRKRILEALTFEHQLVSLLHIRKPKLLEGLGKRLNAGSKRKIFENGTAIYQERHHQRKLHAFAIGV